jgi:YYY domain-containing protein
MIWQMLFWYLLILLLGWLNFPFSFIVFKKLPGRGFAFSRILGLLLWGFGFWLLTSIGVLHNQVGGILFLFFCLLAINIWIGWSNWQEIQSWIKAHWQLVLVGELVFLLGFAFMVLVRAAGPDATGTEKPMELAFINAVIHSETFPPHDPWLSGYAISYYHFGYILAGMLAKVTHTSGGVAFNLMLALTFGMSALGAYGVVFELLEFGDKDEAERTKNIGWALLGPLFLLFISNLEAVLEMLHQAGVAWDLGAGTSQFWAWINIESLKVPPSPPLTPLPQRFWWWWQASRVVQDIDLLGNVSALSPIDEFPAFSFVLGDLHPHVLVMPFVMLLIGISLMVYRGGLDGKGKILGISIPYRWDIFLLCGILLGGIAFLNTWDLPVYFALLTGAYLLNRVGKEGWAWERLVEFLKLALPLGLVSLLLYLPFFISFQSQAGGILPNIVYPTRGLYLWLMFGTLFIPIFLWFGWLLRKKVGTAWGWGVGVTAGLIGVLSLFAVLIGIAASRTDIGQQFIFSQGETTVLGLLSSALLHRLKFGFGLLTLALLLSLGIALLVGSTQKREDNSPLAGVSPFVLLMIVLGGLMVIAPEFVYLRDSFGARMNTVFKFYYQSWMLWSLASAFAAVVILKNGRWFSKVILVVFILMGLVYPVLAYPTRTNGFDIVEENFLDASGYLNTFQPDEAAAIAWLAEQKHGVVVEAVGGQYSSFARVSTHSGRPSVLGWPGHEGQWRGGYEEVGNRESDIRLLYETPDWDTALRIIELYDIRYIYAGNLEQSTYLVNLEKFDNNLGLGFEEGGVSVYLVPQALLAE